MKQFRKWLLALGVVAVATLGLALKASPSVTMLVADEPKVGGGG